MDNFKNLLLLFVTILPSIQIVHAFDFQPNTFFSIEDCVSIPKEKTLTPGTKVWYFNNKSKTPISSVVSDFMSSDDARNKFEKLTFDQIYKTELWENFGSCYWKLRQEDNGISKINIGELEDSAGVVIKGLPPEFTVIGSEKENIDDQKTKEFLKLVTPKDKAFCDGKQSITLGWKYKAVKNHQISEVYFGLPVFSNPDKAAAPKAIESIKICKFIFNNNQLVEAEVFSRKTGQEERVDTEGPNLNTENWADTRDEVIGFIVGDPERDWKQITINWGFEGIVYDIRTLGKPIVRDNQGDIVSDFHAYYYISH